MTLGLDAQKDFTRELSASLRSRQPPNNKLYIIYDDAETISTEVFLLIRLLNNIHSDNDTLVSQLIFGTEQLDRTFDNTALRSITQFLNQSLTLQPMNLDELGDFVAGYARIHQLDIFGLHEDDLKELMKQSRGFPGITLDLLDSQYIPDSDLENEHSKENPLHAVEYDSADTISDSTENTPPLATNSKDGHGVGGYAADSSTLLEEFQADDSIVFQVSDKERVLEPSVTENSEVDINARPAPGNLEKTSAFSDVIADEYIARNAKPPVTGFKISVGVIVVIISMVLGYIISGGQDNLDNRLNDILADDSPLYLDQLSPESATIPGNESLPDIFEANAEGSVQMASDEASAGKALTSVLDETETEAGTILSNRPANEPVKEPPPTLAEIDATPQQTENLATISDQLLADEKALVPALEQPASYVESEDDNSLSSATDIVDSASSDTVAMTGEASVSSQLEEILGQWADSWQEGDATGYLAHYANDFVPAYVETREDWEAQRLSRIDGVKGIEITIDEFSIEESIYEPASNTPEEIIVRFWLSNSRDTYTDDTLKEISFRREDNIWKIFFNEMSR